MGFNIFVAGLLPELVCLTPSQLTRTRCVIVVGGDYSREGEGLITGQDGLYWLGRNICIKYYCTIRLILVPGWGHEKLTIILSFGKHHAFYKIFLLKSNEMLF